MTDSARQLPADPRHERAFGWLLGLHGLALMVVFPLGPQQTRLWHPGVAGVAALVAAFPIFTVTGGLLARRILRLPTEPRTLALIGLIATLPAALSVGYATFFAARVIAGLVAGASYVALYRRFPATSAPLIARQASRIVAFGMPVCALAAAWIDWRATFVPILVGLAYVAVKTPGKSASKTPLARPISAEAAPASLIATGSLSFVSGAYLTVLSGFLVFNAGHTEWHIPACLTAGALLGIVVPSALARLSIGVMPLTVFSAVLTLSMISLAGLLALREALPAPLAVGLIGCFLAINAARHLALAKLTMPRLTPDQVPAHQTHTHLAHHFGSALGALCAGCVIRVDPASSNLTGMNMLFVCGLAATALAFAAGLVIAQPIASPAACAASAKSRWRVAASRVRSVRISIMRTPGSPT